MAQQRKEETQGQKKEPGFYKCSYVKELKCQSLEKLADDQVKVVLTDGTVMEVEIEGYRLKIRVLSVRFANGCEGTGRVVVEPEMTNVVNVRGGPF